MFVGHGLLAFTLVAAASRRFGVPARRALVLGTAAALFATLPDVDILYAPVGLLGGVSGAADAVETFWATGNVTHRGPTHSLLVGAIAAVGFALAARRSTTWRVAGGALLSALVAVAFATSGALDAAIVAIFALCGVAIAVLATRNDLGPTTVLATGLAGLLTHPFGDLLTGSPPDFLYPLDAVLVAERIALDPDPTLHLLISFAVEIAVVWIAVAVFFDLTGRSLPAAIDRRAIVGGAYGAAVVVLPPPTLDAASPFVVSVLSVGLVGAVPTRRAFEFDAHRVVATGLAAVSVAAVAYTVAYLVV